MTRQHAQQLALKDLQVPSCKEAYAHANENLKCKACYGCNSSHQRFNNTATPPAFHARNSLQHHVHLEKIAEKAKQQ